MVLEQGQGDLVQGAPRGGDLLEDLGAVALVADRAGDPAHLAFDTAKPVAGRRVTGPAGARIARSSAACRFTTFGIARTCEGAVKAVAGAVVLLRGTSGNR